jgi:hypothetical protein
MKHISSSKLDTILFLLDQGQSPQAIATATHVNRSTVSRIRSKHCPTLPKSSGGRPLKLSSTTIRQSIRLITSGKVDNAVQVARSIRNSHGTSVTSQTIRRALKNQGLKAITKKKKALLPLHHCRARLDWAIAHQHWTLEDWKRVVWSDETKINRLGSDGRSWVWKRQGEGLSSRLVEGTLKFGGGHVMMWGCFGWDGVGYATRIDGRMDAELYVSILEDELQKSIDWWEKTIPDIEFQQDNDPKHTSKLAKEWFQNHDMAVMQWPANSPDLNPIEHLWSHLKRRLAEYPEPPTSIKELWERAEKEWEAIPLKVCQGLIESMPRRVRAVLKAKGGYTKY